MNLGENEFFFFHVTMMVILNKGKLKIISQTKLGQKPQGSRTLFFE